MDAFDTARMVAAYVLIALGLAGWLGFVMLWLQLNWEREDHARGREAMQSNQELLMKALGDIVVQNEKMFDLYHERTGELEHRLMTMRVEKGFTLGGGSPPPRPAQPFVPEIERALALMEPETAAHSRRLAVDLREAGIDQGEILTRLEQGAGVQEMLEDLERG